MNNYKSFSELKEELGNNYDFKLYEMRISALKEIENLQQENKQLKEKIKKTIIMLEIQIEVIKEQPSDNALTDNMEIKRREMVINLLNEVSNEND